VAEPSCQGATAPLWALCHEYLEGVDLYNRAYFWEAHEEWEALWHAVGHDSLVGRYLQGLIQASAALLKQHSGVARGAASLHAKSAGNLTPARRWLADRSGERFMGVVLEAWEGRLADYLSDGRSPFPFLEPSAAD
jgi:predicted metal-dependent hydrolase